MVLKLKSIKNLTQNIAYCFNIIMVLVGTKSSQNGNLSLI